MASTNYSRSSKSIFEQDSLILKIQKFLNNQSNNLVKCQQYIEEISQQKKYNHKIILSTTDPIALQLSALRYMEICFILENELLKRLKLNSPPIVKNQNNDSHQKIDPKINPNDLIELKTLNSDSDQLKSTFDEYKNELGKQIKIRLTKLMDKCFSEWRKHREKIEAKKNEKLINSPLTVIAQVGASFFKGLGKQLSGADRTPQQEKEEFENFEKYWKEHAEREEVDGYELLSRVGSKIYSLDHKDNYSWQSWTFTEKLTELGKSNFLGDKLDLKLFINHLRKNEIEDPSNVEAIRTVSLAAAVLSDTDTLPKEKKLTTFLCERPVTTAVNNSKF